MLQLPKHDQKKRSSLDRKNKEPIIDHIAIRVSDVNAAANWYVKNVGGKVTYIDDFYQRISVNNTNLAIIDENKYPDNHIGILIKNVEDLPKIGHRQEHRDGTIGVYVKDPFGNMVEYIWYSEEAKKLLNKQKERQ